jgi:hypothetical protein
MPRLVLVPTRSTVARTAPSTRSPTRAPGRASGPALASALRSKSATVIRCPSANAWTLPGFSARNSARQASR